MKKTILITFAITLPVIVSFSQTPSENYIHQQNVKVEGISEAELLNEEYNAYQVSENVSYYDGLNRLQLSIQRQFSPTMKDLVTDPVYDDYGKQTTAYLPYTKNTEGSFIEQNQSINTNIPDFYSETPKIAHTKYPYQKQEYENSPYSRLLSSGAPGYSHQPEQGHTIDYSYRMNDGSLTIHEFIFDAGSNTIHSETDYSSGELFVTEVTDQDGNVKLKYKDANGKLITTVEKLGETDLCTYYIYDDFGLLRCVVPPLKLSELSGGFNIDSDLAKENIYYYEYDEKKRLTIKRLPGKEPEYFVYDERDRLVLSQDGNLRQQGKWIFYKYDIHDRLIQMGLQVLNSTDQVAATNEVLDYYQTSGADCFEKTVETDAQYPHGYTNQSYPSSLQSNLEVLKVNYYDDYDFDKDNDYSYMINDNFKEQRPFERNKGRLTASKVKILGSDPAQWLYTVNYYDKYGRIIQTISDNHLNGRDVVDIDVLFDGSIQRNESRHITNYQEANEEIILEQRYWEYDQAGRDITLKYGIDHNTPFKMYSKSYNELGQLVEKNIFSYGQEDFLQSVDYKYNVRGMLTNINQSNLYNSNKIIDFDTELEPDEAVVGMRLDSIKIKVSEEVTERDAKILFVELSDKKQLIVANINEPEQTRTINVNETEIADINNLVVDSMEYASVKRHELDSLIFDFQSIEFDENDEQAVISNYIHEEVSSQLKDMGYSDTTLNDRIASRVTTYFKKHSSIVYFNEDQSDLFGQDLLYENIQDLDALGGDDMYNGNISGMRWQAAENEGERAYAFDYDNLNRLLAANYGENISDSWDDQSDYDVYGISYDYNGNIQSLKRNGLRTDPGDGPPQFGPMDDLSYTYNAGNKLQSVNDNVPDFSFNSNDFRDNGAEGTDEYSYDANGNMTSDANKGITNIAYNYLNLPEQINFSDGTLISYLYTSDGSKLKKVTNNGSTTTTTDYAAGFVYTDNNLQFAGIEEGRMLYNDQSGAFDREGFLLDHLGNVRVVFADNNSDGVAEVVQENHYYPFGLSMGALNYTNTLENKFKYNSKELDDEAGLRWYDYGFRRYDPQIGRWHVVDALAEKYLSSSPYVYVKNNPVLFIDPNGLNRLMFGHNSAGNAFGACNFGRKIFGPGSNSTHTAWEINVESMHYTTDEDYQRWREAYDKGYTNLSFTQWKSIYTNAIRFSSSYQYGTLGATVEDDGTTHWVYGFYTYGESPGLVTSFEPGASSQVSSWVSLGYWEYFSGDINDFAESISSVEGSEFWSFNQDVSNGLSGVNGINGLFAASASLTIADEVRGVRGTAKALQGIKALKNIGTVTSIFGLGLTTGIAYYEYKTGNANTSTIVDVSIAIGVTVACGIAITVGAPFVAAGIVVGGTVYGITSAVGLGDCINNWSDDWGKKVLYE